MRLKLPKGTLTDETPGFDEAAAFDRVLSNSPDWHPENKAMLQPLPMSDGRARVEADRAAHEWRIKLGLPLLLAVLAGCPPSNPPKPPPAPDASDAAVQTFDGPTTPCQAAYNALDAIHCTVSYTLLAKIDGNRGFELTPDGAPLTCAAMAGIRTVQDALALGIPCGEGGR